MMAGNELYVATALGLIFIGLATVTIKRNLIKMVIGFSVADTGVNLLIVALGWFPNRTAPIIDDPSLLSDRATLAVRSAAIVDPVPQALVLTAIVIGVGVTALMLAYVIRLYATEGSLYVSRFGRMKW